jgi:hypothetical protein
VNDPFTRGFPKDLPVRPSTSAQFDWLAHRRNLFDLRLPETLLSKTTGILTMPIREQRYLDWSWKTGYLESRLIVEGSLCISARFRPEEGCVYLGLLVDNLGKIELQETEAVVCLRLIAAPDFVDPQRKRTFWWTEGRWSELDRGFPKIEISRPDQPALIAVESEPPGFVSAMGWQDVWNVGGNDMLHNLCVHTDPRVGTLGAGESKRIEGMLIFEEGDRHQALEKFLGSELFQPYTSGH